MSISEYIILFLNSGIFVFSVMITVSYVILGMCSGKEMIDYRHKNSFVDYRIILSSPLTPPISIIAPAYNEEVTIIENIKSLMLLHYGNFEVIIVNDGSTDSTMQKLIAHFDLYEIPFAYNERIDTKPIRGIYKSKIASCHKLTIVDKINGGKADAINSGINVSHHAIFACIDVDCILDEQALLKMIKPFLEYSKSKVIATGGVVRIANSCEVEDGKIAKIHLPNKFLPRVQVLEYFRAFLLGRMAWGKLDGLMIISGAFGFFNKEITIETGGYNTDIVGEDMELTVRMRKYMEEKNEDYVVSFIPDPLCWTEVPDTKKILERQRNRWTRGTIETLWIHKNIFFNPKYNVLGMLSYPYWFFFEWLAPIIEFSGLCYFTFLIFYGSVNWPFCIALLALIYTFAIAHSLFAILFEELTFHQYKKPKDMFKLVLTSLLEPFTFHLLTIGWSVKGNIDLLLGKKKNWGEMKRSGFGVECEEIADLKTNEI
ncbi:MAG: glycosyltransferase [Bacteroidota bacterium]